MKGVEVVELFGPHPAGNVGVMINHLKPVNKGETFGRFVQQTC